MKPRYRLFSHPTLEMWYVCEQEYCEQTGKLEWFTRRKINW